MARKSSLNFQHESAGAMVCISVKRLRDYSIPPEKHWNTDLLFLVLTGLNVELKQHETFTGCLQNLVAGKIDVPPSLQIQHHHRFRRKHRLQNPATD